MIGARREALFYQKIMLPLRRRIVHETQLEYNGMYAGGFLLLQPKTDEIHNAQNYVLTLQRYWIARAELTEALGGE